ncbi:MAG: arginine--tRNA ligase [Planctomycetaceae bacterium]
MNILAELRQRFAAALSTQTPDAGPFAAMVRPAQDTKFGDFQANCAMPLAKQLGKPPRDVAQQIVERLDVADLCVPPEVAGPGFINLKLRDDWLQSVINSAAADDRLGVGPAAKPRRYVVDFSSPNVAKPMHVGHLRSTVIGDALCRILRALGHTVISDNHFGDWGTQFGMIIYGYKHFLDRAAYERDAVAELARLYRRVNTLSEYHEAKRAVPQLEVTLVARNQALVAGEARSDVDPKEQKKAIKKLRSDVTGAEEELASALKKITAVEEDPALKIAADAHPDIARGSRDETAKLHAGDAENLRLWEVFLPQCLAALDKIYRRLDISFDLKLGESWYQPRLAKVIEDLQSQGLATESNGALCVFVEGNDAPLIIRKSDGAYTYGTTDLATIAYREQELKADAILYVVDDRQSEHFDLLFATARKWGYTQTEFKHVMFGTVMGEDGRPFKTRAGDTVGLESLLDEAVAAARRIVDENDNAKQDDRDQPAPELDDATRQSVAEIVGLGGIKYADLRHNRESDYVFSWEKMLAKTGDTATYMQYAYARICGILRRGGVDRAALRQQQDAIRLTAPAERALALQLARFPEALAAVAEDYRPNQLTQYLFETANVLSTFYEQCPVLKADDEATRTSRLLLVDLTGRMIERGLSLLGIRVAEKM